MDGRVTTLLAGIAIGAVATVAVVVITAPSIVERAVNGAGSDALVRAGVPRMLAVGLLRPFARIAGDAVKRETTPSWLITPQ